MNNIDGIIIKNYESWLIEKKGFTPKTAKDYARYRLEYIRKKRRINHSKFNWIDWQTHKDI